MDDIVDVLRSKQPLPICPFDRRSPEYWTTPNDKPCKFCGSLPEGEDKCTGADTRIMGLAADLIEALRSDISRLTKALDEARKALEPFAECAPEWDGEPDSLHVFLEWNDENQPVPSIPVADFRRAAAIRHNATATTDDLPEGGNDAE
ncbi:hypothetical protein J2Y63_002457 [Shinella sp. BE166]|uniref:hypothetical protein n=1 Tax=Shinella sp. BE166 TaxID=3373918 RepID=UPI003EBF780F